MGVHINFVCDEEGCNNMQKAAFDYLWEAYGDLCREFDDAGWSISFPWTPSNKVEVKCPEHRKEKGSDVRTDDDG